MVMSDRTTNSALLIAQRATLCMVILISMAGCRFSVGMIRALVGDTKMPSNFEARLGADLTDGNERLLIVCTAGAGLLDESASLPVDILSKLAAQLKMRGIDVVDPDAVATWMDDNGTLDDFQGLADEFEADFVAVIHLQSLTHKEPGSIDLLRARATGSVAVYKANHDDGGRIVQQYETPINETYPPATPISYHTTSEGMFKKQTLDYLCEVLARQFHAYHPRETI